MNKQAVSQPPKFAPAIPNKIAPLQDKTHPTTTHKHTTHVIEEEPQEDWLTKKRQGDNGGDVHRDCAIN